MTNPMLAELDGLRLSHAVCDDGWYSCPKSGECLNDGEGDDCNCGADSHNARLDSIKATLADMAKRLEAAERDAKGERSESWEVWQDDMCVAGSDSLADAQHYMMMYGQDGPVKMVHVVTFRSDVIETVPADQLAIDATQEGEG